jgi:hypothetical protein
MPKSFIDKESQIQYLLMVCKMRGMTVKEIHAEITSTLKLDISINSLYNRLQKYEEVNVKYFSELKKSNHAYVSRIMEIVNHFSYYRRVLMNILYDKNTKQLIIGNPSLLFKSIEMLLKVDQSEFTMLEKIPEIFTWKNTSNPRIRDPTYNIQPYNNDEEQNERSIDQYILSMEQIPVPRDLEELQRKTENENLPENKKKENQ